MIRKLFRGRRGHHSVQGAKDKIPERKKIPISIPHAKGGARHHEERGQEGKQRFWLMRNLF